MPNDKPERQFGFNTRALHHGYQPEATTKARAVPIYQTTSFTFRGLRARRGAVRAAEVRQHLHADHESDHRSAGRAGRFARKRRGGAGDVERPGGAVHCHQQPDAVRRSDGGVQHALRRHLHAVRRQLSKIRLSTSRSLSRTIPRISAKPSRPNTKLLYGETITNPRGNVLDIEAVARDRARERHAADDRQHVRHAVPLPADRLRRRYRGSFHDQVHGRARKQHRRHDRGCGKFDWNNGRFPANQRTVSRPTTA